MYSAMIHGFLTGAGFIIAIGAQNAYVLRQGILRQHVGLVVLICCICDSILILAGCMGVGAIVERFPLAMDLVAWGGIVFLLYYAFRALRSARHYQSLELGPVEAKPQSRRVVAGTALGLTLLNPHVYLDTVVLLGSIGSQYVDGQRFAFAGGAIVASLSWFSSLGFGAKALTPLFARPSTWKYLDYLVAIMMLCVAAILAMTVLSGSLHE